MKNIILGAVFVLVVILGFFFIRDVFMNKQNIVVDDSPKVQIQQVKHASLVLTFGDVTVYVDPVGSADEYSSFDRADIVLITDIHGDHLEVPTLHGVVLDTTKVIAPQAVDEALPKELSDLTLALQNGQSTNQDGLIITAIPMYNIPESEDAYHVKGRGNGYLIEYQGSTTYIAGDTSDIPEMRALQNVDVAFVPMNLPFTMDVDTAADAVLDFAPGQVYPYHYRGQDGLSDVERFKELVDAGRKDIEVILLDWYPEVE